MNEPDPPARIHGLEQLLKAAAETPDAPVDRWHPPHCGDIGLAIRADGTWTYRDSPIARPALVRLFARVLRKDEDGRTYLVTPAEKIDIAVADAHFLAVEMEVRGAGRTQQLIFRTNVDDVVTAGPDHQIRFSLQPGGGVKPYVLIRGRLEALVSRPLTYDLLELAEHDEIGQQVGVWSDERVFALPNAA